MGHYALVFPVLPGKNDSDVKKAADLFTAGPAGYRESRGRAGITLERAYLQKTPMGSFVVAYIESDKGFGETFGSVVTSGLEIDRQFVQFVKEIHGIDLTQPAPGPLPDTIAD